jgi:hypothetical protein
MAKLKSEKIKIYIVMVLVFVAAIVAYFRFMHNKNGANVDIAGHPQKEVKLDVSQIQKTRPKRLQAVKLPENEPFRMNIRDIFKPAEIPTEPEQLLQVEQISAPTGAFELKGIIIGGKQPMAIINDKFVRIGEKIGEYIIVSIDPNEVLLKSGMHEKVLQVLTPGDVK